MTPDEASGCADALPFSRPDGAAEAFFGRRKTKPLTDLQQRLYEALLPALRIDLAAPPPPALAALFAVPVNEVRLEIGFGGGEHLAHEAQRFPRTGFIGAEAFINGVAKMVAAVDRQGLRNVRIHDEDAVPLLDWLPDACLGGIDLFYPDPWPKTRHWKRRFVSEANLDRFARVLRPGGLFRFASDIEGYVAWTAARCEAHPAFSGSGRPRSEWGEPYEGWPGTRYEAKALREGRTPAYLWWRRAENSLQSD